MRENSKRKASPIDRLSGIYNQINNESLDEKIELLRQCSQQKITKTKQVKVYHNILLFLLAYAENRLVYGLALEEMNRLSDVTNRLDSFKKEQLTNNGIGFSETQGNYSFELIKWLCQSFPEEVDIHSFDDAGAHPKELLKFSLNEMEFELIGDENLSKLKWLEKTSGQKDKKAILKWMIFCVDRIKLNSVLKEQIFESMKLYIRINPSNTVGKKFQFSKSTNTIAVKSRYFHDQGLLKKFDERALIEKKLPTEKKLSVLQQEEILKVARVALVLLNRETDPITYGAADGLKMFDLDRGLSIALFSIRPQLRLPIESYVGFMMFKNGYPMAYGGAWLFGSRSLIGINIFEAFRGGESAFVFAQLLRTYRQEFGATQFEVEPYQFGKNNPEGLKSGAFWFYHRFGFRPIDKKLYDLANEEHQKVETIKGYRTPIEILKQFTRSNVAVNFGDNQTLILPAQISDFISDTIARKYNGNRQFARDWSIKLLSRELGKSGVQWSAKEKFGLEKLGVFMALCLNFNLIKLTDRKILVQIIKEKGRSEFEYVRLFNTFPFEKYFLEEMKVYCTK
jgi:hypothetical protein